MQIFTLPDEGNTITKQDIDKGILRITVHAKPYFTKNTEETTITIHSREKRVKYTHRVGRSDLLHIGKEAMQMLQIKEGDTLRFERLDNGIFKIEKA